MELLLLHRCHNEAVDGVVMVDDRCGDEDIVGMAIVVFITVTVGDITALS